MKDLVTQTSSNVWHWNLHSSSCYFHLFHDIIERLQSGSLLTMLTVPQPTTTNTSSQCVRDAKTYTFTGLHLPENYANLHELDLKCPREVNAIKVIKD